MPRITAIVFDKDGTLFDFRRTWNAWAVEFLRQLTSDAPERRPAAAEAIGFDLGAGAFRPDSVVIAGTPDQVAAVLGPVVGVPFGRIVDLANAIAARTPQVPAVDLGACLTELGHGRALGLVTNDGEVPARVHLDTTGIARHFDFVAGYDSGYGAKPDPGPLLAFARATGSDPAETLMVGDSRHDLEAGRRAGMTPVAVLTGMAGHDDLADLAEAVLPDIGHLAAWIAARQGDAGAS